MNDDEPRTTLAVCPLCVCLLDQAYCYDCDLIAINLGDLDDLEEDE